MIGTDLYEPGARIDLDQDKTIEPQGLLNAFLVSNA
jgi:hypothetical protein